MQENVFFFLKTKNSVKYLYDNISVEDGLALMRKHKYTAMPIINKEGVYVGTITEGDFLWYLLDHPSIHKEDTQRHAGQAAYGSSCRAAAARESGYTRYAPE